MPPVPAIFSLWCQMTRASRDIQLGWIGFLPDLCALLGLSHFTCKMGWYYLSLLPIFPCDPGTSHDDTSPGHHGIILPGLPTLIFASLKSSLVVQPKWSRWSLSLSEIICLVAFGDCLWPPPWNASFMVSLHPKEAICWFQKGGPPFSF